MIWLIVLLPLLGAAVNGLLLHNASKTVSHIVGVSSVGTAFILSLVVVMQFMAQHETQYFYGFDWIEAGNFVAPFKLALDPLSAMMLLVVTGVGSLIHIYAGGYMHDEKKTYRFFAYLNLFVFMMLLLVLGENLLVMFVGWEGVGLCSYLLIGYWFHEEKNADAGIKAFVVNRIGDIGFIFGVFLTFMLFKTVSFSEIRTLVENTSSFDAETLSLISWITLCYFIAACGKSAQIPLYIWLPDAMAGPTPVSALIHAATMVTAGILMMTRMNYLFYLAPSTMTIIAYTGALTAFIAASIALVQRDIKKVLAYSTVSQLGYMVMACGVGAFSAGVFHLFTHAFFKALLFLGAGSVIVAMHHKQDMFEMGGLKKYMPMTHLTMLIGVLAIIGFPGLAGFFSKDEILWKAFTGQGWLLWGLAAVTAGFTSFYMVRLLSMTFYGKNRSDHHTQEHLHETSIVMWGPLMVLAIFSAFVGYLGVPHILGGHNIFEHYLAPVIFMPDQAKEWWGHLTSHHSVQLEFGLMGASIAIMFIASTFALTNYAKKDFGVASAIKNSCSRTYDLLLNKYWVDEFYFKFVVNPLKDISLFLFKIIDVVIIDGIVNAVGQIWLLISGITSLRMSGNFQRYGMVVVLGMFCLIVGIFIF